MSDVICQLLGLAGPDRRPAYPALLLEPFHQLSEHIQDIKEICYKPDVTCKSVYMHSLCRAIDLEILQPFYHIIADQTSLISISTDFIAPISHLHVLLHDHQSIIQATRQLLHTITRNQMHIRGIRILETVLEFCQSGIPCVARIFQKILHEYLDKIVLNQVISWIVYGFLSDPYHEFWIQQNQYAVDSWNMSYQISVPMLPQSYLSYETCRSILFIGKALHISRPKTSAYSQCLPPEHVDILQKFLESNTGLNEEFDIAIEKLHHYAASSLWQYIVEEQLLFHHLTDLKSFFFLANGAFYEEFIAGWGDHVLRNPSAPLANINSARKAFQFSARKFHLDESESFRRFRLYSRSKHFTADLTKDVSAFNLCGLSHVSNDGNGIVLGTSDNILGREIGGHSAIWSRQQCCITDGLRVAFTVQLTGPGMISFILQNDSQYAYPANLSSSFCIDFERMAEFGIRIILRSNSEIIETLPVSESDLFNSKQHCISLQWLPFDVKDQKASLQISIDDGAKRTIAAGLINRKLRLLGHRCFIGLSGMCRYNPDIQSVYTVQCISWRELHEPTSLAMIDLALDFQVPKGIDLLLGIQEIDRYSDIFAFLLRIKYVHWYLRRAWTATDEQIAHAHEISLLRSRMQFLLDNLQIYLQVDVIETQFTKMIESIQNTKDFDTMRLAHDRYLAVLAQHCFLQSRVIMKALDHVLDICLQFCRLLDGSEGEHIGKQIKSYSVMFHREACFLFSVISSKAGHHSSPHLEQLILRIDYNGYFSTLLSVSGLK